MSVFGGIACATTFDSGDLLLNGVEFIDKSFPAYTLAIGRNNTECQEMQIISVRVMIIVKGARAALLIRILSELGAKTL